MPYRPKVVDLTIVKEKTMTADLTELNRAIDMSLKTFFNTRERYLDDWKALLAAADERFVIEKVVQLEGSLLAMLEVQWDVSSVKA